jgi:hypothetical protein
MKLNFIDTVYRFFLIYYNNVWKITQKLDFENRSQGAPDRLLTRLKIN